MKGKKIKRLIALLMSSIMLLGILPQYVAPLSVEAAPAAKVKNINLNVDGKGEIAGINDPDNSATINDSWSNGNGSYVFFGNYAQTDSAGTTQEPIKWRVLDAQNDSDEDGDDDSLLLLSDKVLDGVKFNESSNLKNEWASCNLRDWLNSENFSGSGYTSGGFLKTAFSAQEQTAVKATTKTEDKTGDAIGYLEGCSLQDDKIFVLSAKEAADKDYGFAKVTTNSTYNETTKLSETDYADAKNVRASNGAALWWLRSADSDSSYYAGAVRYDGWLYGDNVDDGNVGVAPAFNLNLSSVLFTSASGVSKSSSFAEVKDDKVKNIWKLTLSDGNEKFDASCSDTNLIAGEENQIEITEISNATTDSNQITATLTNKEGEILYYGKIAEANAESATVTIPDTANLTIGETYTLQVFSEQVNGNEKTDYASNMVSISLKAEKQWTSISVEASPTTNYIEGNTFDPTGLVITKDYSDGSKDTVEYSETTKDSFAFNPSTNTKLETTDDTITISYTEGGITKKATLEVDVISKAVSSIEVTSQPNQRNHVEGQKLSLSGLVISLTYNDGTSQEVSADEFEALGITTSIADGTILSVDEHNGQTITVTYEGITAETDRIAVVVRAVTGVEIKNPPDKLSYNAGDTLDLSGLMVTLIYNNGETADVAYADFKDAGITVNYENGDVLTSSANGISIVVTYSEISISAGELSVTPPLCLITTGAGSTYEIGSKTPILVICSGALSDLTGIYVDGVLLDEANYMVASGSTILSLKPDYLDNLVVGTHALRFEYLYGSAETTFKVEQAKQAETDAKKTTTPTSKTTTKTGTSAKTGDTASVMLWIALVLLSGIVIGGFVWHRGKRRR